MARRADQRAGEFQGQTQAGIVEIEVEIVDLAFAHALRAPAPDKTRQRAGHVLRHAQHLSDFAHRAARPIAADDRGQRRALPPIGVVDPLDDFLAPVMLEIHVDIRRLVALLRDETFEEKAPIGSGSMEVMQST